MKKYQIQIARTETTLYCIEVQADNAKEAEDFAYARYDEGDYDDSKVVYGEEFTHEVIER